MNTVSNILNTARRATRGLKPNKRGAKHRYAYYDVRNLLAGCEEHDPHRYVARYTKLEGVPGWYWNVQTYDNAYVLAKAPTHIFVPAVYAPR